MGLMELTGVEKTAVPTCPRAARAARPEIDGSTEDAGTGLCRTPSRRLHVVEPRAIIALGTVAESAGTSRA